ncbi:anion transporter [Rhizobium mesoamericanum]|uniref:anion transporter n=1 Tax=Rhizobium mesoamericanum TaxID=1079800 RepID=UPI000490D8E1|nr:anion transporter [Rhizobium mesoamericanum]
MTLQTSAAVVIFIATYTVVALGKIPGYHLDRAGAALLGASLMLGLGILSPEEAYKAIDFDTITLLLGMMIVVANLRLSGVFRIINAWVARHARRPVVLLAGTVLAAGVFSAFLVNDTVCLVMTPLVLDLVLRLKRDPMPYLLGLATASNIGSVATITGNPQNMIVGTLSGISYGHFAATLAPVAVIGLVLAIGLLVLLFRSEFITGDVLTLDDEAVRYHPALAVKSLAVTAAMILFFFLGQPVAKVAILGGAVLLVTRRVRPEKIYREIDWPLLVMFGGLFIVVAGVETTIIAPDVVSWVGALHLDHVGILSLVTAALSNIVSNVPAVLVLKPFVAGLADPQRAWLVIAMASTLAGNLTLVGSVANLIVAQRARVIGIEMTFSAYLRVGVPLTLATLLVGVLWLGAL